MSRAGLPVVGLEDPVLRFDEKKLYGIVLGGNATDWRQVACNGTATTTNLSFSTMPPDIGTVIDPKVYMVWNVNIQFTGTSASGPLLQLGTADGLRAYPISAAIGTGSIGVTLNNANVTQQMDVITALMRFGDYDKDIDGQLSTTPAMLDQYQNCKCLCDYSC
jgi:hypothetical protein